MEKSFELVQQIMQELHGLHINIINNTKSDLSIIDNGIRECTSQSVALYNKFKNLVHSIDFGTVYAYHDSFLLSYVIFWANPDKQEWYCIGPYLNYELTDKDITTIRDNNQLNVQQTESIVKKLEQVPTGIHNNVTILTAKNMLLSLHKSLSITIKDMTIQQEPYIPSNNIVTHIHNVEHTYYHESMLMHYVSEGDLTNAMREANYFFKTPLNNRSKDLLMAHRGILYTSNTLLRKTAQNIGIHPLFLDEISSKFARQVSSCKSHNQLDTTFLTMVADYCTLCRDHKNDHYSELIQKIIHYILSNISADLTPSNIASFVSFSPSYIARKFKDEVGMTLVNYITEQRIRIAKDLLLKQNMQVQDIASYVGIEDWNYFTKLFKKYTGSTPSNYRKSHYETDAKFL